MGGFCLVVELALGGTNRATPTGLPYFLGKAYKKIVKKQGNRQLTFFGGGGGVSKMGVWFTFADTFLYGFEHVLRVKY